MAARMFGSEVWKHQTKVQQTSGTSSVAYEKHYKKNTLNDLF